MGNFPIFSVEHIGEMRLLFRLIKERLYSIDNYNSALTNERKIYEDNEQ